MKDNLVENKDKFIESILWIQPISVAKMKAKLKEMISHSNSWCNARRMRALRQYITGWVNYFKHADMRTLLFQS